ncbi:multiple inositol polyphosphate phosphatase 1 [Diachasma alloeum]|uniref:multiple inositol polyphosphate phosphatase 1 n=1 Tax=Diachasma alloeum TaxID=454923 RepID=UPI0007384E5F|nr:multiple inositol polyphosphate phosphatase 1 [Diachasma alloeum]
MDFIRIRAAAYGLLWMSCTIAREMDYCFVNETDPYRNFGVKTPYRFASTGTFERVVIPNCKAVRLWMLARHGTRYPQEEAVDRLQELHTIRWKIMYHHEKGMGRLCDEDVENIRRWHPHPHLTEQDASKITDEGWREGEELGKRLKDAYPELFQSSIKDINSHNYRFRSIKASRSIVSLQAMIKGLFGDESAVELVPNEKRDSLLRPDRNCYRWSHADRKTEVQRDEFIRGPEYAELQRNVSRRVGFDVSPATIHNIQDMCRFETAWTRDKVSPWCAIFSKEEWKIIEYIDDIQYYYYSGYGVALNSLIGCFPAEDLINHFRESEKSGTQKGPKGFFYMSTSRVLMDFFHAMGIAKDSEHLLSNNYGRMANRKWRTSSIAPFFANFIASFYRCSDPGSPHKVTFHLNEKLIMYEGCEQGICDWNYIKEKLEETASNCAENCYWSGKPAPEDERSIFLLIIALCVLIIICHRGIARTLHKLIRCNW